MCDGDDADALSATRDLYRHEPDAIHGPVSGLLVRLPPARGLAAITGGELRLAADPGIIYSGGNLHDDLWGDLATQSILDGAGHRGCGRAGVSLARKDRDRKGAVAGVIR